MLVGSKLAPHRGSQVGTWAQTRLISKFFFSETGRIRALIFGIEHLTVDLYQLYSHDSFAVKTGPTPEVTRWNKNEDIEFICGGK